MVIWVVKFPRVTKLGRFLVNIFWQKINTFLWTSFFKTLYSQNTIISLEYLCWFSLKIYLILYPSLGNLTTSIAIMYRILCSAAIWWLRNYLVGNFVLICDLCSLSAPRLSDWSIKFSHHRIDLQYKRTIPNLDCHLTLVSNKFKFQAHFDVPKPK